MAKSIPLREERYDGTKARDHFDSSYGREFDAPRDVSFIFYSARTWPTVLSLLEGKRVCVDLGSGGGTLVHNLRRAFKGLVIGVDFCEKAIMGAREIADGASFLRADLTNIPLADGSADMALSTMVIEHIDDRAFLREASRILKPGGHFVVTTVLKKPYAWYYLKNGKGESVLELSHLREYHSRSEFTGLLEENGFTVTGCEVAPIRFPLIDPPARYLMRKSGMGFLKRLTTSEAGNVARKLTRVPVPGYYSIEAVCVKNP